MKNSFILKNAGPKFDAYYTAMKKRKAMQAASPNTSGIMGGGAMNASFDSQGQPLKVGRVAGKRPAARDGHSSCTFGNYIVVFGGDRHHMPFNDLFCLDIASELEVKKDLFSA